MEVRHEGYRDCGIEGGWYTGLAIFFCIIAIFAITMGGLFGIICFVIAGLFLWRGIYWFSFPSVILEINDEQIILHKPIMTIPFNEIADVSSYRRSAFPVGITYWCTYGSITLNLKNGEKIFVDHFENESELAKTILLKINPPKSSKKKNNATQTELPAGVKLCRCGYQIFVDSKKCINCGSQIS